MDSAARQSLRNHLADALEKHGDTQPFTDDESLFLSGRLDSFAMMNLVMFLETTFGLDFGSIDFDVSRVDSLEAIAQLVDAGR